MDGELDEVGSRDRRRPIGGKALREREMDGGNKVRQKEQLQGPVHCRT